MLNYLYAVLESEVRLTLVAIGLDPGFGLIHVDSAVRDSLVYDLMEPIRPKVDSLLADWLTRSPLKREWFFEKRDGVCRLMPSLVSQLAERAKNWEAEAAPLAEWYAKAVALASPQQTRLGPGTRLTRNKWKQAMGIASPAASAGGWGRSKGVDQPGTSHAAVDAQRLAASNLASCLSRNAPTISSYEPNFKPLD
jgi:CRISPR associated protein Cas1